MKFKQNAIKPGMVIHCPKEEDARVLLEHLDAEGYIWEDTLDHLTDNTRYDEGDTYFLDYIKGEDITFLRVTHDSRDWAIENGYAPIEFSDLIEPDLVNEPENELANEMSAVEVLEWFKKYREIENGILTALFGYDGLDLILDDYSTQEIIDKITAYESAKKKPVDVEWVDIVRIAKHETDNTWQYVHEEIIYPKDHTAEDIAGTILKEYVSKHEGTYHAFADRICRVKEDK